MIFRRGRRKSMYQRKGKRSHASSDMTPLPVLLTKPVLRFLTPFYARRTCFENHLIGRTHPPPNLCLGGPPNLVASKAKKKVAAKDMPRTKRKDKR